ncbi:MAG: chitobiase/beta-hexosaminidase C-terminal domain-containing protein [Paramuribaculum sp.]|nr:chitobiase/beta-hexosaminidase C-terminal domain-containing protein [Paramuribaculum sp.]
MRKFLLLSLVTLLSSVSAMADVAVFISDSYNSYNGSATGDKNVKVSGTVDGTTFTITDVCSLVLSKSTGSTAPAIYSNNHVRCYANNSITITPADGININKIFFNATGKSYCGKLSVNWGSLSSNTTEYSDTWTPGTGAQPSAIVFTVTTGQERFSYIEIEYTTGGEVVTPDPEPEVTEVSSIADFIKAAPTTEMKINAPVTVIYKNGRNMYVKDANDTFILVYNSKDVAEVTNLSVVNGDQLSWISGIYSPYNNLPEMVPTAIGEKTSGAEVDPYEVNVSDITADMVNQYVTFGPVNIASTSNAKKFTATDADGESIEIYNTFSTTYYDQVEVPQGEGFYVTGFVCINNSTLQVTPISIEGGKVIETVATPVFSVASGAVEEGTAVEITCATEGATIYYTTDGSTPSATNGTEYTGAIYLSDAVTLKAIAVKADWYDSEVATAAYTIKQAGATEATFVFTTEGFNLNPSVDLPTESAQYTWIDGMSFSNGGVTLTFDKGTNTYSNSKPVIFYPTAAATKGQIEARIYKDNTITVSCPDGNISEITFEQWSNSPDWKGFTSSNDVTASGKTFVCPEGVSAVVLTSTGTSRFKSINVTYVEEGGQAAIEDVVADGDANAPVEFFNLQGFSVKADNLTPGIYVCRQGSKVMKVLVK